MAIERESNKKLLRELKIDFRQFVSENKNDLDTDTIFQVLQSHGKIKECIKFAEETGCYKELIVHYINSKKYIEALKKLERIEDKKVRNDQMRIYASILLKQEPKATLASLRTDRFRDIEIESLIPALHGIPKNAIGDAREFLTEYCIKLRR